VHIPLETLTLTGTNAALNYVVTEQSDVTVDIAKKPVFLVQAGFETRNYEEGNVFVEYTAESYTNGLLLGVYEADDVSFVLINGEMNDPFAGLGKATIPHATLTGSYPNNYEYSPLTLKANITKKPMTVVFPETVPTIDYNENTHLSDIDLSIYDPIPAHGNFTWTDPTITPELGTHGYSATFVPFDTDNYDYSGTTLIKDILLTANFSGDDEEMNFEISNFIVNNAEEKPDDVEGVIYVTECGTDKLSVEIFLKNPDATVFYNGEYARISPNGANIFEVNTSKPGIYHESFEVRFGDTAKIYTFVIESRFDIDIISKKWNNTLIVDNIPSKNLGYVFTAYQWYINNEPVPGETKQFYSAGNNSTDHLNPSWKYSVEITLDNSEKINTCPISPEPTNNNVALQVYPNPLVSGNAVRIIGISGDKTTTKAHIYSNTGIFIKTVPINTNNTEITLNLPAGMYLLRIGEQQTKIVISD
jgi:hypothetical protein